jgi:protein gp37
MTKIEWVRGNDGSEGLSWNALRARPKVPKDPKFAGKTANHCEHVNGACKFCYAEGLNPRAGGHAFIRQNRDLYTFEIDEKKLLEPLRRKKPTRIFVESMSDAFGEWWPDHFIDKLYAVMALTPWHTYINLSKRPERRREYLQQMTRQEWWKVRLYEDAGGAAMAGWPSGSRPSIYPDWPLPNVIEGVSVSCQEEADAFVPILLDTPAAVRCVSAEPLLGPVDFTAIKGFYGATPEYQQDRTGTRERMDTLRGKDRREHLRTDGTWNHRRLDDPDGDPCFTGNCKPRLDWVIVGGESGPKARPMHPQWARDIRDQCKAAAVAFFYKQTGEWAPVPDHWSGLDEATGTGIPHVAWPDGTIAWGNSAQHGGPGRLLNKLGKKAAGRLLDGIEHNGFPALQADQTTRAA